MKECIREAGDDGGLTEGIISFIIDFLEEVRAVAEHSLRNVVVLSSRSN